MTFVQLNSNSVRKNMNSSSAHETVNFLFSIAISLVGQSDRNEIIHIDTGPLIW